MKKIDENFKKYLGQGENSDLFVSVVDYDRKFDLYFEVDYVEAESKLIATDNDLYPGLEDTALLTSYLDYYQIYEDLPSGGSLVDLGAGYCRGTLLFDALGEKKCVSVEVAKNRVEAASKKCPDNVIVADMTSPLFFLPVESYYFIYLPVSTVLYAIFKKIIKQRLQATFYVIESHGDLIDYFSIHDSLFSLVGKPFKTSTPRHNSWVYKFRSNILNDEIISDENFHSNIPLWHLYNFDSEKKFVIESKIMNSQKSKVWEAKVKNSQMIKYNGELAIYLEKPARVLQLNSQDRILRITL